MTEPHVIHTHESHLERKLLEELRDIEQEYRDKRERLIKRARELGVYLSRNDDGDTR
jgi:hypothetical protein